eukprot:TRINITY_DN4145_c0_g1_i1.p1 TRINITY_DN4145_c0_g1~~TRINITY_DN4145_c0_g1_i1.p1  ORF type:complete len:566 (+),score=42.11 TRINITY_DN4145_c0_g1_i1:653-2350(+)
MWETHNIIFVRSPPYSGKTSLCQLLEQHLVEQGHTVTRISFLKIEKSQTISDYVMSKSQHGFDYWFDYQSAKYLILDELQMVYTRSSHFWTHLKDLGESRAAPVKVIAFAAYGSPRGYTKRSTPIDFNCVANLELLQFKQSEMNCLIEDFNSRNSRKLKISEELKNQIFKLTKGHPGFVSSTLWMFESTHNVDNFGHLLVSKRYFRKISQRRGCPYFKDMSEEAKSICVELITNEAIPISTDDLRENLTVDTLIKQGAVATDDDYIFFSSPLVYYIATIKLSSGLRPQQDLAKNFDHFVLLVLSNIRQSFLQNTLGISTQTIVKKPTSTTHAKKTTSKKATRKSTQHNKLTINKDKAPTYNTHRQTTTTYKVSSNSPRTLLERSWQMEFFRAATSCVGENTFVSPDVGHIFGTTGLVDFYINGNKKWAIELMREGDELGEHCLRWTGLYATIPMNNYALLDFRIHSKTPRGLRKNVWYILYREDYSGATVRRQGCTDVTVEFCGDSCEGRKPSIAESSEKSDTEEMDADESEGECDSKFSDPEDNVTTQTGGNGDVEVNEDDKMT